MSKVRVCLFVAAGLSLMSCGAVHADGLPAPVRPLPAFPGGFPNPQPNPFQPKPFPGPVMPGPGFPNPVMPNPGFPGGPFPAPPPSFPAAPNPVRTVVSSADGTLLACLDPAGKTIELRHGQTGKEIRKLKCTAAVLFVSLAPDGKQLAAGEANCIRLWDTSTGNEVRRLEPSAAAKPTCLGFSPDGKVLAAGFEARLTELWNVSNGSRLGPLAPGSRDARAVAFSLDGKLLATGSGDGSLRLWDAGDGKERRSPGKHPALVRCLAFSPDGKLLASGGENRTLRLWDIVADKKLPAPAVTVHTGAIEFVTFSPDGKTLATAGQGMPTYTPPYGNPYFPGGGFGIGGGMPGPGMGTGYPGYPGYTMAPARPAVALWETATGLSRGQVADTGKTVAFSADGKSLLLGLKNNVPLREVLAARFRGKGKTGPLDVLWSDLNSLDAARAYRAVWALAESPEQAIALLRERVHPAALPVDPREIDRLIADLDSNEFARRHKATEELEHLGTQAEKALREALKNRPALEVCRRLERLLALLHRPGQATEAVRAARAVEVLEHCRTPEARRVLAALAGGAPENALTGDARGALARLGR